MPGPAMCKALYLVAWLTLAICIPPDATAAERTQELLSRTLKLTSNPNRGAQIYAKNCATCHGGQAWGQADAVIPALAGQREFYLLLQLIDYAELNRDSEQMHRVSAGLGAAPEQQWRDIGAYLSALPVNPRPQRGDGRSLDIGSGIYRDSCAQCHGEAGEGDDSVASPALVGQHYSYLLLQIRAMATGHRFSNVESDLALMLNSLTAADMAAIADYISRLNEQPTTAASTH